MTTIGQLAANGIPVTAPANGGPVETKTVVHNVDQLRSLLDLGLDQQGRQAHYEALFNGIQPAATATQAAVTGAQSTAADGGALLSHRIAAHVVGNADLSDEDRAAIAPAFPLTAHVSAAPGSITVSSKYDLSTPDGSVRIVSFTDVTLEQGGYFVCESTPLSFTCVTLTRIGTSGSSAADFNILGKKGATPATPPTPAAPGQPPAPERQASAPRPASPAEEAATAIPVRLERQEPPVRMAPPARRACRRPSSSRTPSPPARSPSTRNPVPAGRAATAARAVRASRAATAAAAPPVTAPETAAVPAATAERAARAARPATAATASTRRATS